MCIGLLVWLEWNGWWKLMIEAWWYTIVIVGVGVFWNAFAWHHMCGVLVALLEVAVVGTQNRQDAFPTWDSSKECVTDASFMFLNYSIVVRNIISFPSTWGNDLIWLLFWDMGWFNHQLLNHPASFGKSSSLKVYRRDVWVPWRWFPIVRRCPVVEILQSWISFGNLSP